MASKATAESTPSASATTALVTPDDSNMMMLVDEDQESESRLAAPREVSMLSKRAQVTGMNGRTFDEEPEGGRGHGGLLSTFLVKVALTTKLTNNAFVYCIIGYSACRDQAAKGRRSQQLRKRKL